jgi:hypothetical protein
MQVIRLRVKRCKYDDRRSQTDSVAMVGILVRHFSASGGSGIFLKMNPESVRDGGAGMTELENCTDLFRACVISRVN